MSVSQPVRRFLLSRIHFEAKHSALVAVCVAWVYNAEAEHAAHIEHIKEENGGELPETPAYDYLNRRSKPFPWGPNTLFFNPHVRFKFGPILSA